MRGDILLWMSPRASFVTCFGVTVVCLAGALAFTMYIPIPSMALGFTILALILGASSAYAGRDWRKNARETGSLK